MPEEEKEIEKKEKKKFPIGRIIFILVAAAVAAVTAGIVAKKVTSRVSEEELEILIKEKVEKPKPPPPLLTFRIGDMSAQLQDMEAPKFVTLREVSIAFKKEHKKLKEELEEREAQIKDLINTILMGKTADELRTPEGKKALKILITNKINDLLIEGKVEDVYCEVIIRE